MEFKIHHDKCNGFVAPFRDAEKHFKIAICKVSDIDSLAKQKIISTPNSNQVAISLKERIKHFVLGILESVGIIFLFLPFIVSVAERHFNNLKPITPLPMLTNNISVITPRSTALTPPSPPAYTPPTAPIPLHPNPFTSNTFIPNPHTALTPITTNPFIPNPPTAPYKSTTEIEDLTPFQSSLSEKKPEFPNPVKKVEDIANPLFISSQIENSKTQKSPDVKLVNTSGHRPILSRSQPIGILEQEIANLKYNFPAPLIEGSPIGLPTNGTTCWLNAGLKFINSSPLFNFIFEANVESSEHRMLQLALLKIIYSLRTKTEVSEEHYISLITALQILKPGDEVGARQLDSFNDFLLLLSQIFFPSLIHTEESFSSTMTLYNTQNESQSTSRPIKHAVKNANAPILELTIPQSEFTKQQSINLSELLADRETNIIVRPDVDLGSASTLFENVNFLRSTILTNAPEELVFYLKRLGSPTGLPANMQKCNRIIELDQYGCISFVQYDPKMLVVDHTLSGPIPSNGQNCRYQFASIIEHMGGPGGGHYISYERVTEKNGQHFILKHNDGIVTGYELVGTPFGNFYTSERGINFNAVNDITPCVNGTLELLLNNGSRVTVHTEAYFWERAYIMRLRKIY